MLQLMQKFKIMLFKNYFILVKKVEMVMWYKESSCSVKLTEHRSKHCKLTSVFHTL